MSLSTLQSHIGLPILAAVGNAMELSGLFSVSGLIQVIALCALLYFIQSPNLTRSQLQQRAQAAEAHGSAPLGLNTPLTAAKHQDKKNKKKKGAAGAGGSGAAGAEEVQVGSSTSWIRKDSTMGFDYDSSPSMLHLPGTCYLMFVCNSCGVSRVDLTAHFA